MNNKQKTYLSNMKTRLRSKRQIKVEKEVQRILAYTLASMGLNSVSVTDVDISQDLRSGVFLINSVLMTKDYCINLINQEMYIIQKELASSLKTKFIPRLTVRWDDTDERVAKLEKALLS